MLLAHCGPPQRIDRAPDAVELARLDAWLEAAPAQGWSGAGRARVEYADGEVEGTLAVVVAPPRRARVEIRSGALFGMVGERVVVSLPGDEHVLLYRERTNELERLPFGESALADLTPSGQLGDLFELVRGRPPWPGGAPPEGWRTQARLVESQDGGRRLAFRVALENGRQSFVVRLRDGVLERLEIWDGGAARLEVEYRSWRTLGGVSQPTQIRLKSTQLNVNAEFTLEQLDSRESFTSTDFEVY